MTRLKRIEPEIPHWKRIQTFGLLRPRCTEHPETASTFLGDSIQQIHINGFEAACQIISIILRAHKNHVISRGDSSLKRKVRSPADVAQPIPLPALMNRGEGESIVVSNRRRSFPFLSHTPPGHCVPDACNGNPVDFS